MASNVSKASWHPAFMPNTMVEVQTHSITHQSHTGKALAQETPEEFMDDRTADSQSSKDEMETDVIATRRLNSEGMTEGCTSQLDNDETLQAALTSTVEPDTPNHDGKVDQQAFDTEQGGYLNASVDSIRVSTASFARTVSHDTNWAENDMEGDWTSQRRATDPFKFMAQSFRTNSFPAVPPAHELISEQFLSPSENRSQAILHEVEQEPEAIFGAGHRGGEAGFFARQANLSAESRVKSLVTEQNDESIAENFGLTYGGDVPEAQAEESQARYEEGIPLMPCEEAANEFISSPANSMHGKFEFGGDANFSRVYKRIEDSDQGTLPSLCRKSTTQVIGSFAFQPHEQTHDLLEGIEPDGDVDFYSQAHEGTLLETRNASSKAHKFSDSLDGKVDQEVQGGAEVEQEKVGADPSSFQKVSGNGVGASKSTVLSAVLGDPEATVHDSQGYEVKHSEGDLAAKWKAALAEDEFLDDDDKLLEDEENEQGADPTAFFGSDDEGFLEDDPNSDTQQHLPAPVTGPNGSVNGFNSLTGGAVQDLPRSSNRYVPAEPGSNSYSFANAYAPAAPVLAVGLPKPTSKANAAPSYYNQSQPVFQAQPFQRRPDLPKAQSFADRTKGGYTSPYDLPMEVVKPRKRTSMAQPHRHVPHNAVTAPPKSGSSNFAQPSRGSTSSVSPPSRSHSNQQVQPLHVPISPLGPPPPKPKIAQQGFFEDLPVATRPRLPGRNKTDTPIEHPASSLSGALPHSIQNHSPWSIPPVQNQPPPRVTSPPSQRPHALVPAQRVSSYASVHPSNTSSAISRHPPAPPITATAHSNPRYSPVPPVPGQSGRIGQNIAHPPVSRQSIPNHAAQNPPHSFAHQPRTSSPLTHFERTQGQALTTRNGANTIVRNSSPKSDADLTNHLRSARGADEDMQHGDSEHSKTDPSQYRHKLPSPVRRNTGSPPQNLPPNKKAMSPTKRVVSNYMPQMQSLTSMVPPPRSQTQSPGTTLFGPRSNMSPSIPCKRPASVEVPLSPRLEAASFSSFSSQPAVGRIRGYPQAVNYVVPFDGREHDPLQRWKGCPIFVWGVGGAMVTSFPKDVPRYAMGQAIPSVVRSLGEVRIQNVNDVGLLSQNLTSFPGPLKGKAKKKDILAWLSSGIQILEQNRGYLRNAPQLSHEDKRAEERILLWKILRVFIEHDGTLEGNIAVDGAVRAVLSPRVHDVAHTEPLYATGIEQSEITPSTVSSARVEAVDPAAVDQLRKHLLQGERERAVWVAVDKRLWAHAMLISNTISKELFRQVAQEFVQKEVKTIGTNTESLAALYEIFAGNLEESIDELVPPSARAGFQLVSTSRDMGSFKDAIEGLDRWQETLSLVLSNRSMDDSQALTALGKLLAEYGRAEAAHICFIFARNHSKFSGIDDASSNIVLVGADHLRQPYDFDREFEPVLLSEVYEFGLTLCNVSTSVPHLAVYKLQHAIILAEHGQRDKALYYCETVASSTTSQTRRSPYHHPLLVATLDDLSKRLKQSPGDESSSWISKPSIDKVSGSVWATFNKFVAGDEQEAVFTPSTNVDIGPFAKIAGSTPAISYEPSNSDTYAAYDNDAPAPLARAFSRYAPGGAYTPPSYEPPTASSSGSQPRSSTEGRISNELRRPHYEPSRPIQDQQTTSQQGLEYSSQHTPPSSYSSRAQGSPQANEARAGSSPRFYSQVGVNAIDEQPMAVHSPPDLKGAQYEGYGHEVTPCYIPTSQGYQPPSNHNLHPENEASLSGYLQPGSSGYEPPASNDHDPPLYRANAESPEKLRPKRHLTDDDDDDIVGLRVSSTAAAREKTKEEKDREAEESFRKAAEEDAKRVPVQASKKGWLGGWFGGKKEPSADVPQSNKPIRAKLGEASSFYYDPDLKRWINKKVGNEATPTPSATPPPPRASGPPRIISNPGAPPGPPASIVRSVSSTLSMPQLQRTISNSSIHSESATELSKPGPTLNRSQSVANLDITASEPPRRPGTSMSSNADSIGDLLGPASAGIRGKGTTRKAKKGRGYIDVMGEKAS